MPWGLPLLCNPVQSPPNKACCMLLPLVVLFSILAPTSFKLPHTIISFHDLIWSSSQVATEIFLFVRQHVRQGTRWGSCLQTSYSPAVNLRGGSHHWEMAWVEGGSWGIKTWLDFLRNYLHEGGEGKAWAKSWRWKWPTVCHQRANSPAEQILPMGITVRLGKKVRTGA